MKELDRYISYIDYFQYAYGVNSSSDEWANFFYFELGDATVTDSCKWEYFIQKYDEDKLLNNEVKCFFNEAKGVDK